MGIFQHMKQHYDAGRLTVPTPGPSPQPDFAALFAQRQEQKQEREQGRAHELALWKEQMTTIRAWTASRHAPEREQGRAQEIRAVLRELSVSMRDRQGGREREHER